MPHIDIMNRDFMAQPLQYSVSPIRFSIGFILFERKIWDDMNGFKVGWRGSDIGSDEVEICSLAMRVGKAVVVAENCVCGHLSFSKQNAQMRQFYFDNPEHFEILEP